MFGRFFFTLIFLLLLPISLLLIFKPEMWQNLYSRLYFDKLETQTNSLLKNLVKSLLSMISTDAGRLFHQVAGILLGLIGLYVFFEKLKIISLF